jgi:hypothetical protein
MGNPLQTRETTGDPMNKPAAILSATVLASLSPAIGGAQTIETPVPCSVAVAALDTNNGEQIRRMGLIITATMVFIDMEHTDRGRASALDDASNNDHYSLQGVTIQECRRRIDQSLQSAAGAVYGQWRTHYLEEAQPKPQRRRGG